MNATELYREGRLSEAVSAAIEEVKRHPADTGRRGFLCELLCFAGQWERADRQLDTLGQQDPQAMMGVALFRQLIRGEQARQQFHDEGRLPELLDNSDPRLQLHLRASICLRDGLGGEAVELLAEAEAQRPTLGGVADGQPFDDFRDLDDLNSSFFEVLTTTGRYYWIPMERVESVEFRKPERPRDLLWRRAHMVVCGGPDGEVFLPVVYPGSAADDDQRLRLGRLTDWCGGDDAPVRGYGQRAFLVGDEDRSILSLEEIAFNDPVTGTADDENYG